MGWARDLRISKHSKDETIVEHALRESNKPIGVATYRVVRVVPAELRGESLASGQFAMLLEGMA